MKGDFSRDNFDPKKHYSAVLMQQGRVQLDADWNEQQAIHQHRIEAATHDLIGASGTPGYQPGFVIMTDVSELQRQDPDKIEDLKRRGILTAQGQLQTGDFLIGPGRYYVDGILCENEDFVSFKTQPDLPPLPNAPALASGIYLVYLDVWRRHITALDDPNIREIALGGPDTTTRIKTVWQVKVQRAGDLGQPVYCGNQFLAEVWPPKKTTGTLRARCSNFRGLENQLYRVEVHQSGMLNQATFKWSRDNGAVAASITNISGNKITVDTIGSDDVHGLASGQWVEVINDVIELNSRPAQLLKITEIDPETCVITVDQGPGELVGGIDKNHPKLRRWDSAGSIPVNTPAGNKNYIKLENGIEVQFSENYYNASDYWLIPARAASNAETGNIEWPVDESGDPIAQPPRGIQHHYCRLALLNLNEGKFTLKEDCRTIFQPPAHLVEDILGLNPVDYQRGKGRPVISLREAINMSLNALLGDGVPGTPEQRVISGGSSADHGISNGTFFDTTNGLITTWAMRDQVFVARLDLANSSAGFTPPQQITGGQRMNHTPHAVALENGEILVVYVSASRGSTSKISLKRGILSDLTPTSSEIAVTNDFNIGLNYPFAVVVGTHVLIMWEEIDGVDVHIFFNRFNLQTNTFLHNTKQKLSDTSGIIGGASYHAAIDRDTNEVWVAFNTGRRKIKAIRVPASGLPPFEESELSTMETDTPFVLVDNRGVLIFLGGTTNNNDGIIRCFRFRRNQILWEEHTAAWEMGSKLFFNPVAVIGINETILLFFLKNQQISGDTQNVVCHTRTNDISPHELDNWVKLKDLQSIYSGLFALGSGDGSIWLFWNRQKQVDSNQFVRESCFRQIITSI